jgi:hypothetical protein
VDPEKLTFPDLPPAFFQIIEHGLYCNERSCVFIVYNFLMVGRSFFGGLLNSGRTLYVAK